jgi:hypothetical protein
MSLTQSHILTKDRPFNSLQSAINLKSGRCGPISGPRKTRTTVNLLRLWLKETSNKSKNSLTNSDLEKKSPISLIVTLAMAIALYILQLNAINMKHSS